MEEKDYKVCFNLILFINKIYYHLYYYLYINTSITLSYSIIPLYWYLLQQDGLLYVVSDVLEYFEWTINVLKKFSDLFERVPDIELKSDPCIDAIKTNTEEAKKVERSNSPSYECVFRRL